MAEISVDVEMATNNADRSYGLMHRANLSENSGMLFIFDEDANHKFWNKNVNFPLSLGFFNADGKLLSIKDMQAHSPIGVSSGHDNVRYVLEVNKGFFEKNNIRLGSNIVGLEKDFSQKKEKSSAMSKLIYDKPKYVLTIEIHN